MKSGSIRPPLAYGPVPSRRLGMSLGVNNIPPKICTYSCVYCQLGITPRGNSGRSAFYSPEKIYEAVLERVDKVAAMGGDIDYITFVPDGEPTIDQNLGDEISRIKSIGIRVAVITNASLLWMEDVRKDLQEADWVSVKVDTVDEATWKCINRPGTGLSFQTVLSGTKEFSREYRGNLNTETMLVAGINDGEDRLAETAEFVGMIAPAKAYLSVPTRPPAESYALPPDEDVLNTAYQLFLNHTGGVECITGYEGNLFGTGGDVVEDILGIASVHPMRRDGVEELLKKAGRDWTVMDDLLSRKLLKEVRYGGKTFYVTALTKR